MRDTGLFQQALGLSSSWKVQSVRFDPNQKRLDIMLCFARGRIFTCPDCGQMSLMVHDTVEKAWRHLNFFQYEAYLTAKVPRIQCDQCGVRLVNVPWARPGSGFTFFV